MKKCITIVLLFLCCSSFAQDNGIPDSRHELRFGIGDMMFETLHWHNEVHKDYSAISSGTSKPEDVNFRYSPHISAEYSYRLLDWLSLGLVCDFQSTSWERNYYNNQDLATRSSKENFFNLSFLLNVRFNYFRREHFGIYSSIAPGLDINGGSETDCFGRHTLAGAAVDLRLVGLTAGAGQHWGFIEFGMMASLKDPDHIFLFGSQLIKIGYSYKFHN